jgi:SAM-dependent methyltransferase
MISTKKRWNIPEMMDSPRVNKKLLHKNLEELDFMNRYTGGHAITLQGVKTLVDKQKTYQITDLGCGSGDTLKYIAQWARKKKLRFQLTGIDKSIYAIQYLKKNCKGFPEVSGIVADYKDFLESAPQSDIYLCSLFCHHLDNESLIELLKSLKKHARVGFVINDLHRNIIAYYSVWILTRLLNGTVLSKNDGPVSVLRAFTRKELEQLLNKAGIQNFSISWKWAFRYRVIVNNVKPVNIE